MPPKRKLHGDDASSDTSDDREETRNKRIARLIPRTRHISERVIKAKWTTLPEAIQDRIKELFHSIELPVLTKQRDEKKRIQAQTALGAVRKNLGKRLPRMPFPPGTKAISFDYEAALNENDTSKIAGMTPGLIGMQRLLESQLATMASSAALLRNEIKREELELARDTGKLEELEKNAKAAKAQSKKQTKNLHPVLRRVERLPPRIKDPADFNVPDNQDKPELLCDVCTLPLAWSVANQDLQMGADPDVLPLVKQLRNHVESMRTNASQVTGIREAITRAQSTLSMLPLG
ncbi:hypothetical protein PRK78_002625 [Emydomyces testavorans]|uniref:Kinetochore protein fta7 n=1 Tax=Emydomyces testavorans TaxID=2070801 RepID=A0AAF0IHQ8_9EURO|nr:hypothetical protein PRK78_002625 [Emydomyces testavorans]